MNRKFTTVLAVLAAVTHGVFASGCQKLRARDRLNRGVQAFKIASYHEAVELDRRFEVLDRFGVAEIGRAHV